MTLDQLGQKSGTDKSSKHHGYLEHYERHLSSLQNEGIVLIECGVGGYAYPDRGGQSLRMWRSFFSIGRIVGFDLHDKSGINIPGVEIYQGSQDDETFLAALVGKVGRPDVFIDDGSHVCPLTMKTFQIMFPMVKPGGWVIIEDTEGSFADGWSAGTNDYSDYNFPHPVNLVRWLMNDINAKYIPGFTPQYQISELHIYANIVFIKKK